MDIKIDIRRDRDHYVVYVNDKFFCSADTYMDAVKELEKEGFVS